MVINQVARRYNISIRTLRYYEELGLITSTRNDSNIRVFSEAEIEKLELILLFKSFNFKLKDIKLVITSNDTKLVKSLFSNKLTNLDIEFNNIIHKRQLIHSILNTFGSNDISKHNIQEIINEKIYFTQNNERLINMLSKTNDIIIEIGKNLIPSATSENANSLLPSIKSLRNELSNKFNINLEIIRVRDNTELLNTKEYRIIQNDSVLLQKHIESDDPLIQSDHIITNLKALVL